MAKTTAPAGAHMIGGDKYASAHSVPERGDNAHEFFAQTRTAYIKPGSTR
ncbi:MAG: hypothetical protein VYD11_05945 [Actinomycetota bacterium]|nr:hypothetical protein [Actinomycetota bacterium]MED5232774.1 hypothetical protein [Actinomycetota bacterium]MEE3353905.1 hypothetical protein [Actinomycetota bacterium]